jgi:hypothetical protein
MSCGIVKCRVRSTLPPYLPSTESITTMGMPGCSAIKVEEILVSTGDNDIFCPP